VGGALDLDGTNDWATSDDGTNLNNDFADFAATDDFSVSFWVNLDEVDQFKTFVGQWRKNVIGDPNVGWAIRDAGPNTGRDDIRTTHKAEDGSLADFDADNVLAKDAWLHLVVNSSQSGDQRTVETFLNGSSVVSQTKTLSAVDDIVAEFDPFVVGTRTNTQGGEIDGEMDELGLWSRVLNSDEVSELYNSGNGLSMAAIIPEPATVALVGLGGVILLSRRRSRAWREGPSVTMPGAPPKPTSI
jgi:hypothetical protein